MEKEEEKTKKQRQMIKFHGTQTQCSVLSVVCWYLVSAERRQTTVERKKIEKRESLETRRGEEKMLRRRKDSKRLDEIVLHHPCPAVNIDLGGEVCKVHRPTEETVWKSMASLSPSLSLALFYIYLYTRVSTTFRRKDNSVSRVGSTEQHSGTPTPLLPHHLGYKVRRRRHDCIPFT